MSFKIDDNGSDPRTIPSSLPCSRARVLPTERYEVNEKAILGTPES